MKRKAYLLFLLLLLPIFLFILSSFSSANDEVVLGPKATENEMIALLLKEITTYPERRFYSVARYARPVRELPFWIKAKNRLLNWTKKKVTMFPNDPYDYVEYKSESEELFFRPGSIIERHLANVSIDAIAEVAKGNGDWCTFIKYGAIEKRLYCVG